MGKLVGLISYAESKDDRIKYSHEVYDIILSKKLYELVYV